MTNEVEYEIDSDLSQDGDNWSQISPNKEVKEEKVEYEVEEEPQKDTSPKQEGKAAVKEEESGKEPDELDGVKTPGAQKRIRQLIKQRKDREDALIVEKARVAELEAKLKEQEKSALKTQKSNLDLTTAQLEEKAAIIKANMRKAVDDDDSEAIVNANEALSKTHAELILLKQSQEAYKDLNLDAEVEEVKSEPAAHVRYDPKADEWISKNEWFGNDNVLTAAALAIDAQLKEEGFSPADDEFYEEVDQRLAAKFPKKFAQDEEVEEEATVVEPSKPRQVVARTSRSPAPAASKKVRLTQEDVELASKWGIPLDRYAARKLDAEANEGEYTTINTQRGVQ